MLGGGMNEQMLGGGMNQGTWLMSDLQWDWKILFQMEGVSEVR